MTVQIPIYLISSSHNMRLLVKVSNWKITWLTYLEVIQFIIRIFSTEDSINKLSMLNSSI